MKPQFALSLSSDGLRLLLRAAGGWQRVGAVDVSSPALTSELATLRQAARDLRPGPMRTKLIIPDDQIRYLSVETGALDHAARLDAARLALEGATPYPVEALAFDISHDGDTTHIAAVAHETLAEAEAFATEHGFNPVSFVAAPDGPGFLGEPFFGVTECSGSLLAKGRRVEPDGVQVVVTGDVDLTAPADPADGKAAKPGPHAAGDDAAADQPSDTGPAAPTETAVADQTPRPKHGETAGAINPGADSNADTAPQDGVAAQDGSNAPATPPPEPDEIDAVDLPKPPPAQHQPRSAPAIAPDAADGKGQRLTASPDQIPDTKQTLPQTPAQNPPQNPPQSQPKDEDAPAVSAQSKAVAALGFASRRGSPITAATPLGGATRAAPTKEQLSQTPLVAPAPPVAPPKATTDSLRPLAMPASPPEPETAAEPNAARGGGFMSRRKPPGAAAQSTASATISTAPAAADTEAHRLTVFGAREAAQVRGKPRFLGLILMAVLLIFLAGVAAWATVFLDDGLARLFQGRDRTLASTLPDDTRVDTRTALADDVAATSSAADEAAADGVDMAALNDSLSDGLTPEDAAVLDALRDPLPEPQAPEDLDAAALEARYAVTGIWPKAPQATVPAVIIPLEDLYITSIDPVSPALDAVALPPAASFATDGQLASVTSPVAAGTSFARDLDGRVIATVEGALSPDGFTVYLGRPAVVPPPTPVRFATDPTENGRLETATQVRPRARPGDLVEQNERASFGGLSRSELADYRPRLRPQAPQETQAAQEAENAPASALAVAQSLRPATRPGNFERIVARATPSPAAASTAAVSTASVAPRSVTPAIPSSASVSREATVRNAINLGRMNLIGVYGTPSDRRALVRLSNGRYQKVQVGDRIDGGRVSAIGEGELRYQKGSRNVVLKMPQG
jgi:hypothetical protein